MIIETADGHYKSVRTPAEDRSLIEYEIRDLDPRSRECVMMLIEQGLVGETEAVDEAASDLWEIPPVPIEEWIEDPQLVGDIHNSIFPQHKRDIIEFFNGGYHEYILTGGTGVGKTFAATICVMRILYELLCLKNPQKALGLASGSPLYLAPISKTKELARRVAFGQIASKLNLSPFFRPRFIETKEEIRFPDKGIYIIGGASSDGGILGMDVISGLVDEGNFMGKGRMATRSDDESYDKAETIYNGLVNRIQSRFSRNGVKGFVFLVSSKRGSEDFTERRVKKVMRDSQIEPKNEQEWESKMSALGVFVRDYSTWGIVPDKYEDQKWWTLAYNPETGRTRIIEQGAELHRGEKGIDFPNDFLADFERDPIGSLRDKAGVSVEVANPFITNRSYIDDMMANPLPKVFDRDEWNTEDDLKILWTEFMARNMRGDPVPICCPNAMRHVALDMSVSGDATGFGIGHDAGVTEILRRDTRSGKEIVEQAPIIHIDAILRVIPPAAGEIDHEKIRDLIYQFQKGGLPIKSVSMDQWSRPPNAQLLKKHGLKVIPLSVDAKLDPYLTMRSALYERRIRCSYHEHLRKEMRRLEVSSNGRKVDHPARGSKDLSDVLTATVYHLIETSTGHRVYVPTKGLSEVPVKKGGWSEGNYAWGDEPKGGDDPDSDLPRYIVV
jgi:hypothetical protein